MRLLSSIHAVALLLVPALMLAACDRPRATAQREESKPIIRAATAEALKQRQVDFLNRIREADPQGRTIDRALLNEQNELGLILDRSVEMDKIPALMRTMLTQMAREFPGEDLTVLTYTPSNPPHKMGTARLNAASRDMTYTAEK